jgi:hypothetical protein
MSGCSIERWSQPDRPERRGSEETQESNGLEKGCNTPPPDDGLPVVRKPSGTQPNPSGDGESSRRDRQVTNLEESTDREKL